MSHKNIGVLINCLEIGGAQNMFLTLCRHLESKGYTVHRILLDNTIEMELSPQERKAVTILGRLPIQAPTWMKLLNVPFQYLALIRFLRRHRIDLMISFMERSNIISLLLPRRVATPIVSIRNAVGSIMKLKNKNPFKARLIRFFYPLLMQRARNINFNSVDSRNDFLKTFHPRAEKTSVIYNFYHFDERKSGTHLLPRNFSKLCQSKPVILAGGRMVANKGFGHLIRAFSALARENKEVQLIILGDGPDRARLTQLIRENQLESRIHLPGFQTPIIPWAEAATCFVLPSLAEGFPNILMESMSTGCPVIAADCIAGPREILQPRFTNHRIQEMTRAPYGVLTPALSGAQYQSQPPLEPAEQALQKAMETLLVDESLRNRLSRQARARVLDFSPQSQGDKWISLIHRLSRNPEAEI